MRAGLAAVLPVKIDVKMPALLVLPGFGEKSVDAPGLIDRLTDLLEIGLPKLSVIVVVTLAV